MYLFTFVEVNILVGKAKQFKNNMALFLRGSFTLITGKNLKLKYQTEISILT